MKKNSSYQEQMLILTGVIDVALKVFPISDLKQSLDEVTGYIPDLFDYDAAHIYLLDEQQEYAILYSGSGAIKILIEQGYKVEIDDSTLVGWCIRNGKSEISVSASPVPLFPMPHSTGVFPFITKQGKVLGVLEMFAPIDKIQKEYMPELKTMANFITIAIENANKVNQLQEMIEDLKDQ